MVDKRALKIFDVDGTLTDSLSAHALFCLDMNSQGNYELELPSVENIGAWRSLVDSPMSAFFKKAGFPEEDSEGKLRKCYESEFGSNSCYATPMFPGVEEMLKKLSQRGDNLAIVTANCDANVRKVLGESYGLFKDVWDVSRMEAEGVVKASALTRICEHFSEQADEAYFVGDTFGDYNAAMVAGTRFIWAGYGWGFPDNRAVVVNNIKELEERLLEV